MWSGGRRLSLALAVLGTLLGCHWLVGIVLELRTHQPNGTIVSKRLVVTQAAIGAAGLTVLAVAVAGALVRALTGARPRVWRARLTVPLALASFIVWNLISIRFTGA